MNKLEAIKLAQLKQTANDQIQTEDSVILHNKYVKQTKQRMAVIYAIN